MLEDVFHQNKVLNQENTDSRNLTQKRIPQDISGYIAG